MGPIQSSINQLSLGILGTAAGLTRGFKSAGKKSNVKSPSPESQPQTEVSSGMGNIAKIGRDYSRTNIKSYMAAAKSIESGNDAIAQKARSVNADTKRLKEVKNNIRQKMINNINESAINEFGITDDFSKSFYMLPDGRMLDGTYKGSTRGRSVDHREISSAYDAHDYSPSKDASGSDYMLDYMKKGNIRMIPENKSIDILTKPSKEQLNQIYKMFNSGKLESINITKPDSKYGETLDILENIKNEEQISNFIRKNFFKFK